jgi:hypothetical protein
MKNLNQYTSDYKMLYADTALKMNNFCKDHFCEKPKYERRGRMNVNIHILFYGVNS